jgi:hypothetical protein
MIMRKERDRSIDEVVTNYNRNRAGSERKKSSLNHPAKAVVVGHGRFLPLVGR